MHSLNWYLTRNIGKELLRSSKRAFLQTTSFYSAEKIMKNHTPASSRLDPGPVSFQLLAATLFGLRDGDFFEWHDNGRLKSKSQYKQGMRHGYFYVWTDNGLVYSRKYYQEDLEDFSRFPDQGAVESGRSLEAIQLETWEGTGTDFYFHFAGDPKRNGMLFIRKTEEPYYGTITALDDEGNKEAVLRFRNGKYHGTISKWNEEGVLWEEGEFDRGNLVQFSIMEGKPFDGNRIIDIADSSDASMVNMLFNE